MNMEINIVEILKDKPQGTKLYSSACGKCKLESVDDKSFKISFYNSKFGFMNGGEGYLDKNGKLYDDGECVVFPSKEMRDWGKFAWKMGDVLVNKDGDVHIIFERFADDTYCSFVGKYYLWKENNDTEHFYENERLLTSDFQKAGKDAAQTYISTIEERLGGKLNRETFEIEKSQLEFKDGDIVYMGNAWNEYIGIIKNRTSGNQIETYAHCHKDSKEEAVLGLWLNKNDSDELRLATNSEKQQLFDALAKKGKAWDAEKKAILDLKPKKSEFKIFQKVLVRNYNGEEWIPGFFFRIHNDGCRYILVCGEIYKQCIPYNDHTEHLLGTTDEWKGGEQ